MREMKKKIPEFKNEEEEFEFWSKVDSTEYFDWSRSKRENFPNLKPTLFDIRQKLSLTLDGTDI